MNMKISLLQVLLAFSFIAHATAADYPSRPIRMLAGFTAGGGSDLAARMVAQKLSEALGQSVVVDNRTGATGAIAAEMLAKAQPDGYTLMMLAVAQLAATAYDERLPYDVVRDYAGVSYVSRNPYVMAVHPSLPARTVREFIDLAKSQPGRLNYGSTGIGGSNHIVTELFNVAAGIKVTHVVQLVFASITSGMSLARAGKVRAMAVSSLKRSAAAPDVPAIAETLPGFETIGWYGVVAPKKTPAALVQRLSTVIAQGIQTAEMKERLAADGSEPVGSTPAEFDRHMAAEVARFKKVIKDAGIKRE